VRSGTKRQPLEHGLALARVQSHTNGVPVRLLPAQPPDAPAPRSAHTSEGNVRQTDRQGVCGRVHRLGYTHLVRALLAQLRVAFVHVCSCLLEVLQQLQLVLPVLREVEHSRQAALKALRIWRIHVLHPGPGASAYTQARCVRGVHGAEASGHARGGRSPRCHRRT